MLALPLSQCSKDDSQRQLVQCVRVVICRRRIARFQVPLGRCGDRSHKTTVSLSRPTRHHVRRLHRRVGISPPQLISTFSDSNTRTTRVKTSALTSLLPWDHLAYWIGLVYGAVLSVFWATELQLVRNVEWFYSLGTQPACIGLRWSARTTTSRD